MRAFYLSAPRSGEKLFYLSSPKHIYLSSPKHIYLSSPKFYLANPIYCSEQLKKAWVSEIQSKIKSSDSYAAKFLKDVNELTQSANALKKKIEADIEDFKPKVRARKERMWGREKAK